MVMSSKKVCEEKIYCLAQQWLLCIPNVVHYIGGLSAKCGVLTEAQKVFDQLQIHDIVSWNS